jgi:hypothetical protein
MTRTRDGSLREIVTVDTGQGAADLTTRDRAKPRSGLALALAVVSGVTMFASARPAHAYNALSMGGGPVVSPDIVPLFWGNWPTTADPNDQSHMVAYMKEFSTYISGALSPAGTEPTVKQYGVWGSQVIGGTSIGLGSDTHVQDAGVYQRIHTLQASGQLPPNTASRVFIVFLKGFTYDFTDNNGVSNNANLCGYHSQNNGTYYAVIPWEFVTGHGCSMQTTVSHELQESMTDPYTFNGWITHEGFGGLTHEEAGDECGNAVTTLTSLASFPPFVPGTAFDVAKISDNSSSTCQSFARPTTSTLALGQASPSVVDVFWPVPPSVVAGGGALGHGWFDGTSWHSETISTGQQAFFVGAPSVVSTASGRLDVYIREVNGQLGHFARATPFGGWSFTIPTVNGTGVAINASAQPSAVTSGLNRTDITVRNWDSSVGHYWSNDNTNFFFETFPSQTIGPPKLLALGNFSLDLFVLGMHAGTAIDTFTNGGGGWSGFRSLVPGVNDQIPIPPVAAYLGSPTQLGPFNEVVFGAGGGGTANNTQSYLPLATANDTNGNWYQQWFGMNATPFGAFAATSQVNGAQTGIEAAFWDNSSHAYVYWHFGTPTTSWNNVEHGSSWDPQRLLGGFFINPPAIGMGADGQTYIMGVGQNRCLWYFSLHARGVPPGSPQQTGICNIL